MMRNAQTVRTISRRRSQLWGPPSRASLDYLIGFKFCTGVVQRSNSLWSRPLASQSQPSWYCPRNQARNSLKDHVTEPVEKRCSALWLRNGRRRRSSRRQRRRTETAHNRRGVNEIAGPMSAPSGGVAAWRGGQRCPWRNRPSRSMPGRARKQTCWRASRGSTLGRMAANDSVGCNGLQPMREESNVRSLAK